MQLSEPFPGTDGCGQDGARIGHSGMKLHTEAIIDLQLFTGGDFEDKPESCTIHLLRLWDYRLRGFVIGRVPEFSS